MKIFKKLSTALLALAMLGSPAVSANAAEELVWTLKPTKEIANTYGTYISDWGYLYKNVIDKNGNKLIPEGYNAIESISEEYLIVVKDLKYGVIDRSGKEILPCEYDTLAKFNETALVVTEFTDDPNASKVGVIGLDGKEIIPKEYTGLRPLTDNLFGVWKGTQCGVIDASGKVVVPCEYPPYFTLYCEKYLTAPGIITDLDGNVLLKDENISSVNWAYDDVLRITFKVPNGEYHSYESKYYNSDMKEIDTKGYIIHDLNDQYYRAGKTENSKTKYGVVDKNFNVVLPVEYEGLSAAWDGVITCWKYENDERVATYMTYDGKVLEGYDEYTDGVFKLTDGVYCAMIKRENGYGGYRLLDANGKLILPQTFAAINCYEDGLFGFQTLSGRVGFAEFGTEGEKVADFTDGLILKLGDTKAHAFGEEAVNDVAPISRDGRTMLPARFVAESLGATVSWNAETQQIIIEPGAGAPPITLTLGSNEATYGRDYTTMQPAVEILDVAPFAENGRTYTPVRFIAEKLGYNVAWDQATQSVIITSK